MRAIKVFVLAVLAVVAACNKSADTPASPINLSSLSGVQNPQPPAPPPPNFVERDGDTYMYVTAVSEEDAKKGVALGTVLSFKYLGFIDGRHKIISVLERGRVGFSYECSQPCRIIKQVTDGMVRRIPHESRSIIGSVFDDAINGHLKPAKSELLINKSDELGSNRIPADFLGEWNVDASACGTGVNDSALRITPTELAFYESSGLVKNLTAHRTGAVTIDALFSGEGETWRANMTLLLSKDGRNLTVDGLVRQRCP